MKFPLTEWMLYGENLPERLRGEEKKPVFSLPGAEDLSAFADLLGAEEEESSAAESEGVSYVVGGLFEEDLAGELTLSKEIDFGAFSGDRALLTFAHISGEGEIFLDDVCIARFGGDRQQDLRHAFNMTGMPCALAVDLTDALMLGRKQTLRLRFCASRPAGVFGTAFLSVTQRACLSRVSILPDALRQVMTVRLRICTQREGNYVLCVQEIPGERTAQIPPAHRMEVTLSARKEKSVELFMNLHAPLFVSGQAYAAPALKIQLFASVKKDEDLLCDEALLLCGYGGAAPRSYLPLGQEECLGDPKELCSHLKDLGVFAVSLSAPAPDALYLEMTRQGIAAVQYICQEMRPMFTRYPCLTMSNFEMAEQALSPQAAAWQMAGSVAFPRTIDQTVSPQEMLLDASGRDLDCGSPGVADALTWLRAVQIRMRAEAARQGRYQGALCSEGEWTSGDISDALRTAFAPVHLSALPLSGGWWTQTRFSASLEAFVPKKMLPRKTIQALAILEDEEGNELARVEKSCPDGGYIGVIEAQLGDKPCVLTLHCRMIRSGEVLEENTMPIYVGDRGPLEAAF